MRFLPPKAYRNPGLYRWMMTFGAGVALGSLYGASRATHVWSHAIGFIFVALGVAFALCGALFAFQDRG